MAYQKDISAILGLSISTVSKALKGYPDVSEETRRKVLKTAEDIDYRCRGSGTSGAAENLPKKYGVIGVLIPEFGKEFKSSGFKKEVMLGIVGEAAERRVDVLIMDCEKECGNMSCMGKIAARNLDGVCLLAERKDIYNGRFAELFESCIPLVSVGEKVSGHISVCCDRRENIRTLENASPSSDGDGFGFVEDFAEVEAVDVLSKAVVYEQVLRADAKPVSEGSEFEILGTADAPYVFLCKGDTVVLTAGIPLNTPGSTNMVKVQTVDLEED